MPDLRYVAFFHLSANTKGDPVGLLEAELDQSGLAGLLGETLLVLPEAFNILGEYYGRVPTPPNCAIEQRLAEISAKRGLCFVAGLINCDGAPFSEAVLIDGDKRKILNRKRLSDGSPCYQPFPDFCDQTILHRGLRIGALICMDAAAGDKAAAIAEQTKRHDAIVQEFNQWSETKLLCVPARFGSSGRPRRRPAKGRDASVNSCSSLAELIFCGVPARLHFYEHTSCDAGLSRRSAAGRDLVGHVPLRDH